MHLMLSTPGGDGETAVRLVRSAQRRCRELTVIVPDQAESAGTILALGAHHILLGPTSDLGPIDPQFQISQGLVSAKDIIAALGAAEQAIQANPDTYSLHASLLADVTALMVQQARSALARSEDIMREALTSQTRSYERRKGDRSMPERNESENQVAQQKLVEQARSLPGVAAVLDIYGRLSTYTQFVNVQPSQVRNATGGNAS